MKLDIADEHILGAAAWIAAWIIYAACVPEARPIIYTILFATGVTMCTVIYYPIVKRINIEKYLLEKKCHQYIEDNKIQIGLFVRPSISKNNITLANKYCAVSFSISNAMTKISILDKMTGKEKIFRMKINKRQIFGNAKIPEKLFKLFTGFCTDFSYEKTAQKLENTLYNFFTDKRHISVKTIQHKNVYIDINRASEAEFTGIPGINIAKAKHAVKVRDKYAFYLSVNQFYEAINLEEQFIEQIKYNGNKILLNNLPEYQKIEMKDIQS